MIQFLVQYVEDGILQVVSDVKKKRHVLNAKYYDGRYYEVKIITRHPSRKLLEDICRNMEVNVPVVILPRYKPNNCEAIDLNNNEIKIPNEVKIKDMLSEEATTEDVPAVVDFPGLEPSLYSETEIIATVNENGWNYPSEILAEAVRHDVILLSNEILGGESMFLSEIENKPINEILMNIDSVQNEMDDQEKEKNKKAPQKKHCCFYCQKVLFKMYRHYITVHKTEKEVREIIVLPVKSGHRKLLLDKLRKKGDYFFNTTLKNENQSDILCRDTLRNVHGTSRDKNVPCPRCLGFYSKLSIRHHVKNCFPIRTCKKRMNIQAECRKLLNNIHKNASEDLKTRIFPVFNDDEVSNIIRYDEAIITYGNYMCRKYTTEHHAQQIRSNLRAFGRLMLAIRESNPHIKELSEVLDPVQVDVIINAIDTVARLDKSSHLYKAPATAMLLATELKRLCKLLTMEYARNRDKEGQKRMEDLLLTFNLEFEITVNKRGLETQKINNRRKKTILPKTEHIAEFRIYLEGRMRYFIDKLERCYCQKDWVHLAEFTLVHLAVFNRKRPGETQRILVDDYKNYEILNEDDVSGDTDAISKEQIKKWARIRLTGKLGKNTALLVHRDLGFKALDLILQYREKAGVNPENRYLFGEPSNTLNQNTFQACHLIRKFSYESEIANPELLRTRLLRQHLATETAQSQVDQRLEGRVSDFMSHKRQIHEDYYVITQKSDDITKVSKLLENFSSVNGNSKHDSNKMKQKSQASPQNFKEVSSDEEYFPDRNNKCDNNKMKRKSQNHPQSLKEVSHEEYVSDGNMHSGTRAELKRKSQAFPQNFQEVSSDEEYFPDRNYKCDNNKMKRKSQTHPQSLKEVSHEEYVSDGNMHSGTRAELKRKSQAFPQNFQEVSSDEEYFPDRNYKSDNNKMKRKSQTHPQSLKEVSHEEYVSDRNKHPVTQAELNFLIGKKQTRHSWTSSEKSTARQYFHDEIYFGNMIRRDKIKEFYESNKELYKYRTPHLIMQWVKCQRNEILARERGNQGKRIRWSTPEKEVLRSSTERHSSEGTTPTLPECELIFEKNKTTLKNRNPSSIKSFIYSEINRIRND